MPWGGVLILARMRCGTYCALVGMADRGGFASTREGRQSLTELLDISNVLSQDGTIQYWSNILLHDFFKLLVVFIKNTK